MERKTADEVLRLRQVRGAQILRDQIPLLE